MTIIKLVLMGLALGVVLFVYFIFVVIVYPFINKKDRKYLLGGFRMSMVDDDRYSKY